MGWLRAVRFAIKLWKEAGEDDVSDAAAGLAYKFFLALFPFFIFLLALSGFVADVANIEDPRGEIMSTLASTLPADAYSVINTQVENLVENQDPFLLSFGIVGAIWAASSGMGSFMKASNRVYEVKETRGLIKRYAIAVGLTVLAGGFITASLIALLAGQFFGVEVASWVGLEGSAATVFVIARWPAAIALLMVAVAFLFWAAPNIDLPFKWVSPGAVLFVVFWLIATLGFGLYVGNFGTYDNTYGALGGVVVLLVWLYLTSFILLLGTEFNAVLAQQTAPVEVEARAGDGATAQTAKGGKPKAETEGPPRRRGGGLIQGVALKAIGAGIALWAMRRAKQN